MYLVGWFPRWISMCVLLCSYTHAWLYVFHPAAWALVYALITTACTRSGTNQYTLHINYCMYNVHMYSEHCTVCTMIMMMHSCQIATCTCRFNFRNRKRFAVIRVVQCLYYDKTIVHKSPVFLNIRTLIRSCNEYTCLSPAPSVTVRWCGVAVWGDRVHHHLPHPPDITWQQR